MALGRLCLSCMVFFRLLILENIGLPIKIWISGCSWSSGKSGITRLIINDCCWEVAVPSQQAHSSIFYSLHHAPMYSYTWLHFTYSCCLRDSCRHLSFHRPLNCNDENNAADEDYNSNNYWWLLWSKYHNDGFTCIILYFETRRLYYDQCIGEERATVTWPKPHTL